MAGAEAIQTTSHPNDLAKAWESISDFGGGETETWGDVSFLVANEPFANPGQQSYGASLRDGLVQVEPDQYKTNIDDRMAMENQERMKQSEAEVAEFERKRGLSLGEYWKELRDEYAQNGVNIGLIPDVREMQKSAQEYLKEKVGGEEQVERADLAVKTELGRMARTKAEEVRRWQSEGRGLPITFESEWIQAGEQDMAGLLGGYYGDGGELASEARENQGLSDEEKVAWLMAALPQEPGTLNPVWVFKSNRGAFAEETVPEYYNRLKNYRKQNQMREWQIEQDRQRLDGGVDEQTEERRQVVAEKREVLRELGENPLAKTYGLGEDAFLLEDQQNGEMKVLAVKKDVLEREEAERAQEQWERDPEGVKEAIRETDAEIMKKWQEEEKERASREELAKAVAKKPKFLRVVKKLVAGFVNWMKLEDTSEEDEAYYNEMERQEKEKAEKAEMQLGAVGAEPGVEPKAEPASAPEMMDVGGVKIEMLKPKEVEKLMALKRRAELALDSEKSWEDLEERRSIAENYQRLLKILEAYERAKGGDLSEVIEYQTTKELEVPPVPVTREVEEELDEKREMDEDELEFSNNFHLTQLQQKGWFSGELNEKGLEELRETKSKIVREMFEALEDEDNKEVMSNVLDESRERLREVDWGIDWLKAKIEAEAEAEAGALTEIA